MTGHVDGQGAECTQCVIFYIRRVSEAYCVTVFEVLLGGFMTAHVDGQGGCSTVAE
jgi:hypothetical protein